MKSERVGQNLSSPILYQFETSFGNHRQLDARGRVDANLVCYSYYARKYRSPVLYFTS
jgi:hypothetical protein